MPETSFEEKVLDRLGALHSELAETKVEVKNIVGRLDILNSKVARHEKELNERRNQCPLVDLLEGRVRPLEDYVTAEKAAERAAEKAVSPWFARAEKIGWLMAGLFGLLALQHATSILPFLKG